MPTKFVDQYEIEYTAEPLDGSSAWGAYVAIFAASTPMHRENILVKQRVAADQELTTEALAETAAENASLSMLDSVQKQRGPV